MGARRKSSPGPLLILFTTNLRTRTVACMAVHVMHAPCIHLNSSVHTDHMRTDPHRYMHRYDHDVKVVKNLVGEVDRSLVSAPSRASRPRTVGQRAPQKTARRRAARTPQWKEARRWHARSVRVYHRRVRCRAPARLPERTAARREQSKGSLRQSQRGSQRRRRHHHRRVQGVGCDVATSRTSDDPWGVGGDACARRGRTDVRRRSRKACRTHKKCTLV